MPLHHFLTRLSALLLAFGLAACSPDELTSANPQVSSAAVAHADTSLASGLISPQDYVSRYVKTQADHILIDVRTPQEFASGHIAGALNIPLDQISRRLSEIPKDQQVVLYCRSGNRSSQAARLLKNAGYNNILDLGGVIAWQSAGHNLTR